MAEHKFYITTLKNVRKHPNADRLMLAECFGNTVIVSTDYKEGQLGCYFPVDLQLSERFCEVNNLVTRKDENGKNCGGYLDPGKRNIKAIRLRGEKSDGLFLPLTCLSDFCTISSLKDGEAYDVINGEEICRKYIPKTSSVPYWNKSPKAKITKINICPTFHQHVETEQLAYNLDKFNYGDTIEITLKMHGTSGRTGYLPVLHNKKSFIDKMFKRHGKDTYEYGYITGTRRVVLDNEHTGGFYEDNTFRNIMSDKFSGKLHRGEVVYYEIVGFQGPNGAPIMSSVSNKKISDPAFMKQYGDTTVFSYGCDQKNGYYDIEPCCDIYVYRMTMTNPDGVEIEYSPDQMRARCAEIGVKTVPVFERVIIPSDITMSAGEYVVRIAEDYFDGADIVGKTHVREGVVVRILNKSNYAVYKHKNFNFKLLSGIAIDNLTQTEVDALDNDILEEM